ncbi:tail fiber assembly domain protein [Pseudomonas syringae]|uniref:tail fiber assembly domain protein n=1 Tax=Pseudomonas syringae TaxID=317 RepID=UPI0002A7916E|nr:tail fiber assembly domain protein [Pseudomonas syringae]ALE00554.1 tail fiber assembly protein [Pseudomonas syringae UMAF0158]ELQ11229.1 tail fiber assembly domain protein [Pseudomonas syringae BRIP39023]MCK9709536.1 phage tail assembly chaperone [Pseudomonas syringae pv. syringae]MCK9719343.1 phage tail assembly chaperone [Pseudomonas syringae pv. syringae]MCK9734648.1 phage tail assembly chaperone [Pseudomonas syringae pv. syringae]
MNIVPVSRNPQWADLAHTSMTLWVIITEPGYMDRQDAISVSANHPDPQYVAFFNRAIAGEFGEILEPSELMILMNVNSERSVYLDSATKKINELDFQLAIVQNAIASGSATDAQIKSQPALQAELDAYSLYRAQLSNLEQLTGFPISFVWPVPPATPFVYVEPPVVPAPPTGVSEDELPWFMNSIRNPRWVDQAHTAIVLLVVFEKTKDTKGEEAVTVAANSLKPQARELFNRAFNGEFGVILEPITEVDTGDAINQRNGYSAMATAKIDSLISRLGTVQSAIEAQLKTMPALQAELNAYWLYRVQLAQLDAQPGFPESFVWPVPPASPFVYVKSTEQLAPVRGVSADELPKS